MNSVNLIGRLTRDPEIRKSGDLPVASYTLAVDRAKDQADFIRCVAFGKPATFAGSICIRESKSPYLVGSRLDGMRSRTARQFIPRTWLSQRRSSVRSVNRRLRLRHIRQCRADRQFLSMRFRDSRYRQCLHSRFRRCRHRLDLSLHRMWLRCRECRCIPGNIDNSVFLT